ncbi:ATP-binding protein [Phocaeicola sp.]|nr:ATP-binding protein [Bacteroides sp.]
MKKQVIIKNEISEISKLQAFVDEMGEEWELSPKLVFNLNLVLEEAVSNIILYAYPKQMGKEISITADKNDNILLLTLTDTGKEFNPTEVPEVDITLSAEERPIGGLGIFLIKNIMNEVEYQRVEGTNVFTLKKILDEQ